MMTSDYKVAVIGGGWYGCYCALRLRQLGISVTLYEAKNELFRGVSEKYGIRLHIGPHYPRSAVTRKESRDSFTRFMKEFPNLYVDHKESIFCLGIRDSDGLPPRVDWQTFKNVCKECEAVGKVTEVDCTKKRFTNVVGGFDVTEPSLYMDEPRHYFSKKLNEMGINIVLNHKVTDVHHVKTGILLDGKHFDKVVNCTYYKDLVSKEPLPFNKVYFYQPSLTLVYAQRQEYTKLHHPFSFTVMDGWFPTLMPLLYKHDNPFNEERKLYVLYHAKYTLLGSFETMEESNSVMDAITDEWVQKEFVPMMEDSIKSYYSDFDNEFEYVGWKVDISCKIHSSTEFRSTLVWPEGDMLHVLSGKVGTIFQAGDDVVTFIERHISEIPSSVKRASCELQNDNLSNYIGSCNLQSRIELNFKHE